MDIHRYRSILSWRGSTRVGYEHYDRTHRVTVPPAPEALTLASSPAFRGDPGLASPEQLLLAAASSCQLLSFLARAARARIDVLAYDDDAEALMPKTKPMRITRITLRPRVAVAPGADEDRVIALLHQAHRGCFVANTLNAEMVIEPAVAFAEAVETAA